MSRAYPAFSFCQLTSGVVFSQLHKTQGAGHPRATGCYNSRLVGGTMRLATMSVVLYFSTLAIAQKATTSRRPETALPVSKATIEVGGVVLRLGMTKAQVAEKLVGNEISKMPEDEWMLGSLEKKNIGPTLQFTKGVLSYADREWANSDNDIGGAL